MQNLISVVGYGTFITKGLWKDKKNVVACIVEDFIRIFPRGNWFPYVLPLKKSSFWALKFDVDTQDLKSLDYYEGVSSNLYKRVETRIRFKDSSEIIAFIYVPTDDTIQSMKLTTDMDPEDRWKEEIIKYPGIIKKFPELIT